MPSFPKRNLVSLDFFLKKGTRGYRAKAARWLLEEAFAGATVDGQRLLQRLPYGNSLKSSRISW